MVQAMPKFGSEIVVIISGISKLLLIMGITQEDDHFNWFGQLMRENLEVFS
jgi:hypothetical protein